MRPRSMRRCARVSTGSLGRLSCGMRRECARRWLECRTMGIAVSPAVKGLLDSAPEAARVSWYSPDGPQCYNPTTQTWETIGQQSGHARVADFRRSNGVVKSNAGASLVDVGDGIGCIELHSLKNAIGGDVVAMISSVLNPASEAVKNFRGFVISGDRDRFSVGANLMQLLLGAQEGDWEEVEGAISAFQQMSLGDQVLPAAGGGGAFQPDAGRRRGDLSARRATAAVRGDIYRAGGDWDRADSRRRRNEGDAAACGGCGVCGGAT